MILKLISQFKKYAEENTKKIHLTIKELPRRSYLNAAWSTDQDQVKVANIENIINNEHK